MKLRILAAILACRLTRFALRLLRRGGTALPGKIAVKICPTLLGVLAMDVKTIVVTGTNGKTTTSRIIEQAFADGKLTYFANRSGANLISGITGEFVMHSTLTGRPKCEYAVIECDEAASKEVLRLINPHTVLVTNVFRDQLDRYGEVMHTLDNIRIGLKNARQAVVCLNADCSMTASLAGDIPNEILFFGVDTEIYRERVSEVSDAPHCIRCKAEYVYDRVTYGHLGAFRCPSCGYSRPKPQISVTGIVSQTADCSTVDMQVFGQAIRACINLPGGYNIYNAAAAVTALSAMGFLPEDAAAALERFECGFGRMEKFRIGEADVRMILVKNPAGCNQVLNFLSNLEGDALFVICLNDRIADGTDVSWIWDVSFERLCDMGERLSGVVVSGVRAFDMATRLKYAGLTAERLSVVTDYGELISEIAVQDKPVFIMPTYTAMLELRDRISTAYGYKDFWE